MRNKNQGFTLGELLITVAIISILTGISLPVFSNQLEESREKADINTVRNVYAEVLTAGLTMDEEATTTIADEVILKTEGLYQATVYPLNQTKDDWNSSISLNVGGVTPLDSSYWIGIPKAGGKCVVSYIAKTEEIFVEWLDRNDNSSVIYEDIDEDGTPDEDISTPTDPTESHKYQSIKDLIINNNKYYDTSSAFIGISGDVYLYDGENYVCINSQEYAAGGSPLSWYQWQFIEINENTKVMDVNDIVTDEWGNSHLTTNRGDVYEVDGRYFISNISSGWMGIPPFDTNNWTEINMNK